MKNLHILPTDKPSRLYIGDNGNFVFGMIQTSIQSKNDDFTNQNSYITNSEEIKEGDWLFDLDIKRIVKADNLKVLTSQATECWYYKKVILTTDQDLINDGVQAIDDEFLEWFVKNPSCEEVEVQDWVDYYKIFTPKEELTKDEIDKFFVDMICNPEEPKYSTKKEYVDDQDAYGYDVLVKEETKQLNSEDFGLPKFGTKEFNDLASQYFGGKPKQETLEEAEKEFEKLLNGKGLPTKQLLEVAEHYFIVGYELAQERSYSEEEVIWAIIISSNKGFKNSLEAKEWWNQFKNK